ncbi:uncharacterized protein [Rutidosis leptorrhynchoides]|uniref:uncharacterized protein n=1 Tax=Rutidosis leptorrhynchoides TaxID=125765 RepID=UPI003A996541
MKIISYNIRDFGLGPDSKLGQTKKLIRDEKPLFFTIQETKLLLVDRDWIAALWGNTDCDFIQREMTEKSGGQLLIGDTQVFEAAEVYSLDRVISIMGTWKADGSILNILNVYGPHENVLKKKLWESLGKVIESRDEAWVVCGDFNEVRNETERFNCVFKESRAKRFNEFINNCNLLDIPLGG